MTSEQKEEDSALKPGAAAPAILSRAFARQRTGAAADATSHERLLYCIACDYGTQALVLETLIEILVRKGIMTEDEFEELLQVIDARDGRIDGTLGQASYLGDGI